MLFVCTGNLCRSPIAERLTRAALARHSAIVVESAGTHVRPGERMTSKAVRALEKAGVRAADSVARQLTSQMIREADLLLVATRAHRAWVVSECPRAVGRVFTIAEFGALADVVSAVEVTCHDDLVRRASTLVTEVQALRGLVQVDQPDIPDPYGGSARAYRATVRRVQAALASPIAILTAEVTRRPEVPAAR
ncbi:arsenate reductase/protein-tyrosine-phosphatase family protein [Sphaerisporangium perillae]|uniref:arsenate reductase/protein-tyrosine-phosphatase family protein n=1 Tax=Sphaerisporangium perillae TaxID=2935860 RepID=UPI00200C83B4|nr:hypothetical protein [Sphaerisporangium perillae]